MSLQTPTQTAEILEWLSISIASTPLPGLGCYPLRDIRTALEASARV